MEINVGTFKPNKLMVEYVNQVIQSGRLSYGPFSKQFEQQFAQMHKAKYAIFSNSGTSSLLVALQTLKELDGWQDGDEVIVPALTFVATVNIVLQAGMKPVLIDIEPDFYGMNCELIPSAINSKTRAIMPVHTFGQPALISEVCYQGYINNLKVIIDSCEAVLVKHRGAPLGEWGNITCFSTYMAHFLPTGVGGIAITNDRQYAQHMRSLVNHGMSYFDLTNPGSFNPQKMHRDFLFTSIGHSARLTELEAAIGLAQLDNLPATIAKRQANAAYLINGLQKYESLIQLPETRPQTEHSFMMFPIVCKTVNRKAIITFLNDQEIATRLMLPLTNQPVYHDLFNEDDYPVAKWINQNGFYIGCHQDLRKKELDYIIAAFGEFFDAQRI